MDEDATRLFLHGLLQSAFPNTSIYYRPPGNILLEYPCIIYEKKAHEPAFANSYPYAIGVRYQVTLLSKLPGNSNTQVIFGLANQGVIVIDSDSYESDDVVHDVFTISVNSLE